MGNIRVLGLYLNLQNLKTKYVRRTEMANKCFRVESFAHHHQECQLSRFLILRVFVFEHSSLCFRVLGVSLSCFEIWFSSNGLSRILYNITLVLDVS